MTDPATARALQSVSEIRRFFRTATTPVYFVSATAVSYTHLTLPTIYSV